MNWSDILKVSAWVYWDAKMWIDPSLYTYKGKAIECAGNT